MDKYEIARLKESDLESLYEEFTQKHLDVFGIRHGSNNALKRGLNPYQDLILDMLGNDEQIFFKKALGQTDDEKKREIVVAEAKAWQLFLSEY